MQYTPMFPEKYGGTIYRGRCPLPTHDDSDPSFWVDTRTGLCGCFGNCELNKKSTDVIGLYAKINGITYGEAIREMRGL
jgi:DNA primase